MPTNRQNQIFLAIILAIILAQPLFAQEIENIKLQPYKEEQKPLITKEPYLLNMSANTEIDDEIIRTVQDNKVDLQAIFYAAPEETNYPPIKLEASLTEAVDLSLADALATAIERNINLNIAKQDSLVAKWDFWQQFSTMLPDLEYNLKRTSFDGAIFITPDLQRAVDQSLVNSNFRINYRAFSGGTNAFLTWAQKHYKNAVKENEVDQFNKTIYETVVFYNDLLRQQVSLNNRQKSVQEAHLDFDQAQKFLKGSIGTKYDVYQAEARFARSQQEFINQQAGFRESEINLAEHLNMDLTSPLKVNEAEFEKLNLVDNDISMKEFLNTAKENNPRIKSALLNKKGAVKEALSKIGNFLPNFDLFADIGGTGAEASDLTGLNTYGFQLSFDMGKGAGLSPVSDAMRSKAAAKKAKLEYQKAEISIEKELRLAFLNFEKAKSLIIAAAQEVKASKEGLRLARLRYENGIGVMNEVVTRQKELSDSQINLIDSIAQYNDAQAQMAYEMGTISIDNVLKL